MRFISVFGLFKEVNIKLKSQQQSDEAEGGWKMVHNFLKWS